MRFLPRIKGQGSFTNVQSRPQLGSQNTRVRVYPCPDTDKHASESLFVAGTVAGLIFTVFLGTSGPVYSAALWLRGTEGTKGAFSFQCDHSIST